MIVCICSNVSEITITKQARYTKSVEELITQLNICKDCKTCYNTILDIFNHTQNNKDNIMSDLLTQITADQLAARKSKDIVKISLLTTLLGEIQLKLYTVGVDTNAVIMSTLKYFLKNINDTYSLTGSEISLIEKSIIEAYLPTELDELTLKQLINDYIREHPDATMGMIMKYLKNTALPINNAQASVIIKGLL